MDAGFLSTVISASLEALFSKVTDGLIIELQKIKNAGEIIERLEITMQEAQNLLSRVDTSLGGVDSSTLKNRIDTIKILCYDAEDVIDEIAFTIKKRNSASGTKCISCAICVSLKTWTLPHGISKVQEKLDGILGQLRTLIEMLDGNRSPNQEIPLFGSDTEVIPYPFIGRDDDMNAIIQKLVSCHSNNGVSIVGMNGLGKSALAQTILHDREIVERFPLRLWITVSDGQFNMKETTDKLAALAQQVTEEIQAKESSSSKVTVQQSYRNLLIAFDNVLDVKLTDWDNFWSYIKSRKMAEKEGRSSDVKFLITTTNPRISDLTGTEAYFLKPLSDECCKRVIMEKASFHYQNLDEVSLSATAGKLASKCEGLPLVARIIGLLLAPYNKDRWDTLVNADLWEWPAFNREIFPVLRSSYLNMRPPLKKCLAYFSLFPHNYRFERDDLIQLWVGEGFIQQPAGSQTWEQIGSDYFNDLTGRSILQISDHPTHVGRPRYELHKFSQKFAQLAASRTCLQLEKGDNDNKLSSLNIDTRHLSLLCRNIQSTVWSQITKLKCLRTILTLSNNQIGQTVQVPPHLFRALARLRLLSLKNTNVVELPNSIYKLKHLRYLDVSNTPLQQLPDRLSKLGQLQFLKLKNTPNLTHLPKDFQNLTNLLYLDWDISDIVNLRLPPNIGQLTSLQTLPLFPVGGKEGHTITELRNMNCLQGSIRITNLENVKDGKEAEAAMLHNKSLLSRIELQWNSSRNNAMADRVLMGLKPHDHLKELKITNYGCSRFPEWINHPFPMLEKIHLQRCLICDVLPELGQLQALRTLVLEDMGSLTQVQPGQLPILETLEFNDMANLQRWIGSGANDTIDMPSLRVLKCVNCPDMVHLPSLENLTSLVNLQITRCGKMSSLPNLPASLKSLTIKESMGLKIAYPVGGTEWSKLGCVPCVEIDDMLIQTSNASTSSAPLDDQHHQQTIIHQGYQLIKDSAGAVVSWLFIREQ